VVLVVVVETTPASLKLVAQGHFHKVSLEETMGLLLRLSRLVVAVAQVKLVKLRQRIANLVTVATVLLRQLPAQVFIALVAVAGMVMGLSHLALGVWAVVQPALLAHHQTLGQ